MLRELWMFYQTYRFSFENQLNDATIWFLKRLLKYGQIINLPFRC